MTKGCVEKCGHPNVCPGNQRSAFSGGCDVWRALKKEVRRPDVETLSEPFRHRLVCLYRDSVTIIDFSVPDIQHLCGIREVKTLGKV